MKNLYLSIYLVISLFVISCDSSDENNPEVPQDVIDNSLDLFDGEVIEKKLEEEEGSVAWEVKIQNNEGSIVKFYWTINGLALLKIEGQTGPFEYNILPGNNLINFSTAKTVAFAAIKNDALIRWELSQEDEFINTWVYTFEIGSQKVYIDAENGNVLQTD